MPRRYRVVTEEQLRRSGRGDEAGEGEGEGEGEGAGHRRHHASGRTVLLASVPMPPSK